MCHYKFIYYEKVFRSFFLTIEKIAKDFGQEYELNFANVGDQMGISLIDGLGDKIQSSSWLLKK